MAAFLQGLAQLGWTEGRNLRIDSLWAVGNPDNVREYAAELATLAPALAALAPDVILTNGTRTMEADVAGNAHRADRVRECHRPGRRRFRRRAWRGRAATPPVSPISEYSIAGKWLELLKEIAPGVTRVAVLRDPAITAGIGQWAAIQAVAPSLGVEVIPVRFGRRKPRSSAPLRLSPAPAE